MDLRLFLFVIFIFTGFSWRAMPERRYSGTGWYWTCLSACPSIVGVRLTYTPDLGFRLGVWFGVWGLGLHGVSAGPSIVVDRPIIVRRDSRHSEA